MKVKKRNSKSKKQSQKPHPSRPKFTGAQDGARAKAGGVKPPLQRQGQKKIACDEPTESLPSGDFVLIQFFEGLMPSVTGARSSSGGLFNPLNECYHSSKQKSRGIWRIITGNEEKQACGKSPTLTNRAWAPGKARTYRDPCRFWSRQDSNQGGQASRESSQFPKYPENPGSPDWQGMSLS